MKRKYFICLIIAMLLVILAVPAFAEPTEPTEPAEGIITAADPNAPTEAAAEDTSLPLAGDESTTEAEPILYGAEATTSIIMPYNEEIMPISSGDLEEDAGIISQRSLTYGALGLGAIALLLSIIALARTRRKSAPNATGNYQKYF